MWVATQGDQKLTSYTINLSSGTVTKVGSASDTGTQPSAMAITPDASTVFLIDGGDSISVYSVSSIGSLCSSPPAQQQTCPPVATVSTLSVLSGCTVNCGPIYGHSPVALTVDPSGKFLFVADQGQANDVNDVGGISIFSISGTTLTPIGPACPASYTLSVCPVTLTDPTTGLGIGPSGAIAAPAANFLYVADKF